MSYILSLFPALLEGAKTSVLLFFIVLAASIPLGFGITLLLRSRIGLVRAVTNVYVYLFRGSPLMLQLFIIYFGLPYLPIIGPALKMGRFTAALIGFILNYAAYFGEIFRGGLIGIDQGQYEAAEVLGYSRFQMMVHIILPQMFRISLPAMGNEVINLLKDTSLLYAVSVPELLQAAKVAVSRDANITALVIALVIYLILNFVLTILLKLLEGKFQWKKTAS